MLLTQESYTQRLEALTQQSQQGGEDATDGSATSVIDPDVVWCETAFAPYKNRVYGMESFFASSLRTSTFKPSSGSTTSRAVEAEEGIDLRLQVQKLQRILQQQAQEFNDYRKRYQEILKCVTSMDEFRLEWRESLKQIQHMEVQMEVYQVQMRTAGIDLTCGRWISLPSAPST
ncbi:uncharacterized protein DS421_14g462710 [Arachis hypogaea]|nr:uncharacterized protein DS421_14g462710 [Arachis hypogaea]